MILANLLVRQRRKAGFEKRAELAELKNFPLTPLTNNEALVWEAAVGGLQAHQYRNEQDSKMTLVYRLDNGDPGRYHQPRSTLATSSRAI